jgi:hypothetical protein
MGQNRWLTVEEKLNLLENIDRIWYADSMAYCRQAVVA